MAAARPLLGQARPGGAGGRRARPVPEPRPLRAPHAPALEWGALHGGAHPSRRPPGAASSCLTHQVASSPTHACSSSLPRCADLTSPTALLTRPLLSERQSAPKLGGVSRAVSGETKRRPPRGAAVLTWAPRLIMGSASGDGRSHDTRLVCRPSCHPESGHIPDPEDGRAAGTAPPAAAPLEAEQQRVYRNRLNWRTRSRIGTPSRIEQP